MKPTWQTESDHIVCRWSEGGECIQYNPPWMQEALSVERMFHWRFRISQRTVPWARESGTLPGGSDGVYRVGWWSSVIPFRYSAVTSE